MFHLDDPYILDFAVQESYVILSSELYRNIHVQTSGSVSEHFCRY
jgi:hypothetical protein